MANFIWFPFFLLGLASSAFGQAALKEWPVLETTDFKLVYPTDWDLDQKGKMGAEVIVFSPLTSSSDVFRDNVNYLVQDLQGQGISFEQYSEITKSQIPQLMTDGRVIELKASRRDSKRVLELIYEGKQGQFDLIFHALVLMQDDQYHVLTFTVERESYEELKEIGLAILNQFELK